MTCHGFIASVPVLLWLAWTGRGRAYLLAFGVVYATDFLDGLLARRLKQETELGATLDHVADVAALLTVPLAMLWNWPEILRQEAWGLTAVIGLYGASVAVSALKFGRVAGWSSRLWRASRRSRLRLRCPSRARTCRPFGTPVDSAGCTRRKCAPRLTSKPPTSGNPSGRIRHPARK